MHQGLADFRYRRRDSDMDDLTYAQTYAKTMLTAYEKARLEGSKISDRKKLAAHWLAKQDWFSDQLVRTCQIEADLKAYSSSLVAYWAVDNPNIVPSENRGRHSRVPISLHRLAKNTARIRPIIIEAGRQEIQYRSTPDDRSGLRVNERSAEQVLV